MSESVAADATTAVAPTPPARAAGVGRNPVGAIAPLLTAGGFMLAYAFAAPGVLAWPRWPVSDASERVVYWIGLAAIFGVIADLSCMKNRRWLMPVMSLAAALACLWPNLGARVMPGKYGWSTGTFALWLGVIAIATTLLATLTQRLAARERTRPLVPLVLTGMAAAAGGLLMSTGSRQLGASGFCLAGAIGVYALLSFFIPAIARSAGVIVVTFAALANHLASGSLWSSMPIGASLSIAVAPLIAWVVLVPPLAGRSRWVAVPVALVLAAIPSSIVVGLLAHEALKATAEDVGGFDESSLYK